MPNHLRAALSSAARSALCLSVRARSLRGIAGLVRFALTTASLFASQRRGDGLTATTARRRASRFCSAALAVFSIATVCLRVTLLLTQWQEALREPQHLQLLRFPQHSWRTSTLSLPLERLPLGWHQDHLGTRTFALATGRSRNAAWLLGESLSWSRLATVIVAESLGSGQVPLGASTPLLASESRTSTRALAPIRSAVVAVTSVASSNASTAGSSGRMPTLTSTLGLRKRRGLASGLDPLRLLHRGRRATALLASSATRGGWPLREVMLLRVEGGPRAGRYVWGSGWKTLTRAALPPTT